MDDIPPPVRRFVEEHIDSVGLLEVLLLLESDPERAWTTAEVSAELRSQPSWASAQLQYLAARGLAARAYAGEPTFRYGPASRHTQSVVAQLRRAFQSRRVKLVALIYARASNAGVQARREPFRLSEEA